VSKKKQKTGATGEKAKNCIHDKATYGKYCVCFSQIKVIMGSIILIHNVLFLSMYKMAR